MTADPRRWSISSSAAYLDSGDRIVVLGPSEVPLVITEPGATIWRTIGSVGQHSHVMEVVAKEFATPVEMIRDDILSFVADLAAAGLVDEV